MVLPLQGQGKLQHVRDRDLESIVGVAVFPVQGPGDQLVEGLERGLSSLCDVAHDGVHRLALVVPFLALDHILGGNTTLGKIDVTYAEPMSQSLGVPLSSYWCCRTLLLIDTEDDDNLVSPDANQLLNTTDTSPRQFGKQDHSVNVVVLEQLHVCAHLGDLSP